MKIQTISWRGIITSLAIRSENSNTLFDNVFEFSDRIASEVMIPRQDMVCIFIQDSFEEILTVLKKYGHTRYPLCDNDKDHVLGLVHMRDIFLLREQEGNKDI